MPLFDGILIYEYVLIKVNIVLPMYVILFRVLKEMVIIAGPQFHVIKTDQFVMLTRVCI